MTHRIQRLVFLRALLRPGLIAALVTFTGLAGAAEARVDDGLVPIKARSFDRAWQRPDANFNLYTGILLKPVSVAFSKEWRARDYGPYGLKEKDVERIRSTFADIARDSFASVLSKSGYRVVEAPGPDVLEVQVEVADLYVNAPDFDTNVFVRNYVRSYGEMRLLITLRDSASGATLFRSSDRKRGDETGRLEWANSVYNRAEAQRALTEGARQLKTLLREKSPR